MTDNLPAPRDKHARLTPITGLQPIWRSAYQIEHAGSTWTVDASSVNGNGTWKLVVTDHDPWFGDYGKLTGWSMTF